MVFFRGRGNAFQQRQVAKCDEERITQADTFDQSWGNFTEKQQSTSINAKAGASAFPKSWMRYRLTTRFFQAARRQPALKQSLQAEKIYALIFFFSVAFRLASSTKSDADFSALNSSIFSILKDSSDFEERQVMRVS